ncbi:transient receptor potential cation channel subfamily V member 1-like [Mizuhopecten yessoensis]|uniref:Transient receptor potential cation channel subfamily V member 3 n=1 Tax=Mizuhopecten yessoensis TaxID=6573 RepID=A0A210R0Y3_MIZYE|nr:transient receptor potential cation channel subfamily V member 1-like [Mizuhopecten yessoensis]OWF54696.1 Transient receptor potential cation channel subfamily V member 3 [Mizuhopecten yessoensis]
MPPSEMKLLQDAIHGKNVGDALSVLKHYTDKKNVKSDVRNYRCRYDENGENITTDDTILHLAAAFLDERHYAIIDEIVKLAPDLLASGKLSKTHSGQTPLHILIVRKQNDTLRRIKDLLLSGELEMGGTVRNNISNPKVEGEWFRKTIMEGELPHIVAALTLDIDTAEIVLEMTRTDIKAQNSEGNTVYHCLVEHAARYPEEIQGVTAMWNFLTSYDQQTGSGEDRIQAAIGSKYALRLPNKDLMRPLQLAALHGVATLFNLILNSERILNAKDRLFDSYLYDISVIDTVAHFKSQREKKEKKHNEQRVTRNQVIPSDNTPSNNVEERNNEQVGTAVKTEKIQCSRSVLEMMCNRRFAKNKNSVFEIIRQPPMKMLIDVKWKHCWRHFYIWAICHIVIMAFYSAYAIERAVVAFPSNSTHPETTDVKKDFVSWMSYLLLPLVGAPYLLLTVLLVIARCKRPTPREYITHDIEYIVLLFLFSFGLLVDSICHYSYLENCDCFLVISLLSGWWFTIFFFRAFEALSFYVAMILKVIFGDLLRFGLFILLALVSFSTAFQVLVQGSCVPTAYGDETYKAFFQTALINFLLMFGLEDIEFLREAREPAMAYIVYLVYVIMTYLVLLNSLIAMISETCASVRENGEVFFHTQRLYVILFLEEITYPFWLLGDKWIPCVSFEERPVTRNEILIYRSYFLKMTSNTLENESYNDVPSKCFEQVQQKPENFTIKIQQPFLEESFGNDNKPTFRLMWNDEKK